MGQYKKLGINTLLVFIGTSGSKLMTLFMLPLYTRWLTASEYGSADLITVYSSMMLGVISLSIFDSLFVFPSGKSFNEQRHYFSAGLWFWLINIAIIGVATTIGSYFLSLYDFHNFIIDNLWFIFSLLFASFLQQICQQFTRAIGRMEVYSFTGLVNTAFCVLFSFLLIKRFGVSGYIFSLFLGNIFAVIYTVLHAKLYKYFDYTNFSFLYLIEMLKYSIPIIPNGIMWFFVNAINRPLLEANCGLVSVGLMAVASKVPSVMNMSYMIFQQAFLVSVLEEANKKTYMVFYNNMLKLIVVFQIVVALFISFLSEPLIKLFTTDEFHSCWMYVPALTIGVLFTNIATFVGSNFAATKQSKYYFYSSVWAGISAIILNTVLIPDFEIRGACISIIASQFICMVARIYYSWNFVKICSLVFYIKNGTLLILGVAISTMVDGLLVKNILFVFVFILFALVNINYCRQLLNKLVLLIQDKIK